MGKIYNKTVKELIKEFLDTYSIPQERNSLGMRKEIKDGGYFSRQEILAWVKEKYPKIKEGTITAHLILLSVNAKSRIHYNVHSNGTDDYLFQIDKSNYRLFQKGENFNPIYKKEDNNTDIEGMSEEDDTDEKEEKEEKSASFAYEKELQNFLSKNLSVIELGLKLFKYEAINGIEFPAGGRFIDILALDKENNFVVIELKVSKGYDRVIGQLLRYMAWIEKNLAEDKQKVRGMIICKEISSDLKLACSKVQDVSLFEYELYVKLRKI